jgi:tetratricopeptide (TPR) repeat protein
VTAAVSFPPALVEALQSHQAVVVAGRGCDELAGWPAPPWLAVIDALAARLFDEEARREVRGLAEERAGEALAILRERLLPEEISAAIAEMAPAGPTPPLIAAVAAAPWPAVITTGFADLSSPDAGPDTARAVLTAGMPATVAAPTTRLLIQALGRPAAPESLCLSPADWRAKVVASGLLDVIADLARRASLVFVGFQPGDPDLEWLAGSLFDAEAGKDHQHFFLGGELPEIQAALLRSRFGLETVGAGTLEEALAAILAHAAAAPRAAEAPAAHDRWEELETELASHTEGGRWQEAATTIVSMAELEPDHRARARYLHGAALVHRDRLGDMAQAATLFEAALDEDPHLGKAWDALDRLPVAPDGSAIFSAEGRRRCYGRALLKLGDEGNETLRARLWDAVAAVSADHLADAETDVAALEAAQALAPDEQREAQLAARYLALGADRREEAVDAYQRLAARTPGSPEPYRALARLWADGHSGERLRWACAVLEQLGEEPPDLAHYRELPLASGALSAPGTLQPDLWIRLYHPDEDRTVSEAFALMAPVLALAEARPREAFVAEHGSPLPSVPSVPAGAPIAAREEASFPAVALATVARALGVSAPDLFLGEQVPEKMVIHNLSQGERLAPALLLGADHALSASPEGLIFVLARAAALLRPEWQLRFLPAAMATALRVGRMLADRRPDEAGDSDLTSTIERLRASLGATGIEGLTEAVRRLPDQVDLPRWAAACELSAARAALVMCGDMAAAGRVLAGEDASAGVLAADERLKDLLAFAVSEDHFAVRQAIAGSDLATDAPAATATERDLGNADPR